MSASFLKSRTTLYGALLFFIAQILDFIMQLVHASERTRAGKPLPENFTGLGISWEVFLIVFAGAMIPAIMFMRRAVAEAKRIKGVQEIYPVVNFLRETQKLWHYTTIVLIVAFIIGVIAAILAGLYYLPTRSAF